MERIRRGSDDEEGKKKWRILRRTERKEIGNEKKKWRELKRRKEGNG